MSAGTAFMARPSKPKRDDVSTKIDVKAVRLAHTAAAAAGMTLAEWLSDRVYRLAKQEVESITPESVLSDSGRKASKKSE